MAVRQAHPTSLYWFRRSIRLDDNRALLAALDSSFQVVPVFVLDPTILTRPSTGAARTRFLFESLAELDADLRARGGRLIIRHGKPVEELERLVHETGATGLYFSRDYGPYSHDRDARVEAAMRARGVTVSTENDHLIFEPGEVMTKEGHAYTVFTPFKRRWAALALPSPQAAPERVAVPEGIGSEPLPALPRSVGVDGELDQEPLVRGGEKAAREHLNDFLSQRLKMYATDRDFPAVEGTSRLSAYLKFGVLSPRRIAKFLSRYLPNTGPDVYLSELCWRDFYYQILFHFPQVAEGAFKPAFNRIQWNNREDWFEAWREGRTGYPIVDAAQRQLNREAWMHNRARMITASFLTKDLHIDWRWGEKYFMQKLIDGDQASNNGGWQWAAGTGTDAQPYFRIFNPVSQGEKFDPSGDYVRRYVPELARVPAKYIHRPWELRPVEQEEIGCVIGRDYPAPIVDHAVQRQIALTLYRSAAESRSNDDKPDE